MFLLAAATSSCRAFVRPTLANKTPSTKVHMIGNILGLMGGMDKSTLISPEKALPGREQKMANIDGLRHYVLGNKLEEVPEGYEVAGEWVAAMCWSVSCR